METFPILNLPLVALKELLKNYNPLELLLLSQISKRMCETIPLAGTKNIGLLLADGHLEFNNLYYIHIIFSKYKSDAGFELKFHDNDQLRAQYSNIMGDKHSLVVFNCDDKGMPLKLAHHVSAVFKCPIESIQINSSNSRESLEIIKKVVEKQDGKLKELNIIFPLDFESLQWIINNITVFGTLSIDTNPLVGFKTNSWSNCEILQISCPDDSNQAWFTFEHFMALKFCRIVILYDLMLTYKEIDAFMQEWKKGKFPKLQELRITDKGSFEDEILGKTAFELSSGVEIQADDGTEAFIKLINDTPETYRFHLTVSKKNFA